MCVPKPKLLFIISEHHLGKGVFICRVHNSLSVTANDVRWTNWCFVAMLPNSFSCSCHIAGPQKPSFVNDTGLFAVCSVLFYECMLLALFSFHIYFQLRYFE
jgi:hypothetical protein